MKKIVDCATNQEIERELTQEEIDQESIDSQTILAKEAEKSASETVKQEALSKLGLTAEEAKALFG